MGTEKEPAPDRIYKTLLRALPFDFRSEFGSEMESAFQQQRIETKRDRGFLALLKMWWSTVIDIFRLAPREHFSILLQDTKYAFRMMRKNLGFTLATVIILGLGIGANTAIFSVVNSVLLKPLPYSDGDRLLVLRQPESRIGVENAQFSVKELQDLRDQSQSLNGVVEYHNMAFTLYGRGEAHLVRTGVVSAEFFDFLGVRPLLGRSFNAEDEKKGADPVLVLSYEFWKQVEGGDPNIVGRTYQMNDRTHTVIGVLPAIPQYPDENDVYMPTSACPFRSSEHAITGRDIRFLDVFARLKSSENLEHCRADLAAVSNHMQHDNPESYSKEAGFQATASFLREDLTKRARLLLLVLLGAAGFVLLIACANVANLILSRMSRREQELVIRTAMGAGNSRLFRQLLTESFLLALLAAAIGLLFAGGSLQLLTQFASQITPRAREIAMDHTVLGFAILCAMGTSIVFGSVAALHTRHDLSTRMKEGGRTGSESNGNYVRAFMIAAQVAFSYVLLIGAGLMVRSFMELNHVNPGFVPQKLFVAKLHPIGDRYGEREYIASMTTRMVEKIDALPGVMSSAISSSFPLDPDNQTGNGNDPRLQVEGETRPQSELLPVHSIRGASTNYFKTLGTQLVAGRMFLESDNAKAPEVVILNHNLAVKQFGTQDPIGKRVSLDEGKTWVTIVGVVADTKEFGLGNDTPNQMFVPLLQHGFPGCVLVRTSGDPAAIASTVHRTLREIEPEMAITGERTMEQVRSESVSSPRTMTRLLGLFAGLALLIAVAGIGSMLALWVRQRMHEIGIRMALGASPGDILGSVIRRGMLLVIAGLVFGLVSALALTRLINAFLFQVQPTDTTTYFMITLLLLVAAFIACFVPARRASRIDPQAALRSE